MRAKTFLLTSLFVLILSPAASAAEKLRVAFSIVGVASSPSWIAVEKGLWKKYGLDVELILLSGGTDGRTS
jgi:ABC-type nitrate/sulfonate/bicarbonate transport system substrate-binding protein